MVEKEYCTHQNLNASRTTDNSISQHQIKIWQKYGKLLCWQVKWRQQFVTHWVDGCRLSWERSDCCKDIICCKRKRGESYLSSRRFTIHLHQMKHSRSNSLNAYTISQATAKIIYTCIWRLEFDITTTFIEESNELLKVMYLHCLRGSKLT